jgi:hypothetical protein
VKKVYKRIVAVLLLVCVIAGTFGVSKSIDASSKSARYSSHLFGPKNKYKNTENVKSFKFKGKKVIITASLKKAKDDTAYYSNKVTNLKMKKRTFKLASNCKFYAGGGEDGLSKVSKKDFLGYVKLYNGLGLVFYTNKSGKIVKMVIKC